MVEGGTNIMVSRGTSPVVCRGSSDKDFFSTGALGHSPHSCVCLEKDMGKSSQRLTLGLYPAGSASLLLGSRS